MPTASFKIHRTNVSKTSREVFELVREISCAWSLGPSPKCEGLRVFTFFVFHKLSGVPDDLYDPEDPRIPE